MTDEPLTLWAHLVEFRRRLIYSLVFFFAAFLVSYVFSERVLGYLARPLTSLFAHQAGRRFIYTSLTEAFVTYLKVASFSACVLSCPFWAFQIWQFIKPALSVGERSFFRSLCLLMPFLFGCGAALAYYVVCPCAWQFFLSFESSQALAVPLQFEAKISEYLGVTIKLMIVFGLGFQLPVVLSGLVGLGILSVDTLKHGRKYAFLLITIIAALITPPDLISPLGLLIPLYGLYEITVRWMVHRQGGRKSKRLRIGK